MLVLLVCAIAFTSWLTLRPSPAAHAATTEAEYGDNTEEVAVQRWQNNQARHWRHVITRR